MNPTVRAEIREAAKRSAAGWPPPTAEEITWLREFLGPLAPDDVIRLRGRSG